MTITHLCIDMQVNEARLLKQEDWQQLRNTVIYLKDELHKYNVPTINVGMVYGLRSTPSLPFVWSYTDVAHQLDILGENILDANHDLRFNVSIGPKDPVAIESQYSAFRLRPLMKKLEETRTDTVILSGLWEGQCDRGMFEKNSCILTTANDFARAGFRTIIASEATNYANDSDEVRVTPDERRLYYKGYNIEVEPIRTILKMAQAETIKAQRPERSQPLLAGDGLRKNTL